MFIDPLAKFLAKLASAAFEEGCKNITASKINKASYDVNLMFSHKMKL